MIRFTKKAESESAGKAPAPAPAAPAGQQTETPNEVAGEDPKGRKQRAKVKRT